MADVINYEEISYGKVGYKRIQRLRSKGQKRGIEVPQLSFELTKPEKPRIAFWITAIVSIVVFVGILVGAGFLVKYLIDLFSEVFKDSGGFFKTLFDPALFIASSGLSVLPILLIVMAYLMLALIVIIPFIMALYCYRFARNTFYMARCSKEEFAKGEFILGRITNFIMVLAVSTILLIVFISLTDVQVVKIILALVYVGIVIIFGSLLALMIVEKVKCNKWFETLDEDKKQNYIAHERSLRRVKSRLNFEKKLWDDMFK